MLDFQKLLNHVGSRTYQYYLCVSEGKGRRGRNVDWFFNPTSAHICFVTSVLRNGIEMGNGRLRFENVRVRHMQLL